jgi:hypothetical protein
VSQGDIAQRARQLARDPGGESPLQQGTAGQSVLLTTLGPAAATPFQTIFSVGSAGARPQALSVLVTPPTRADNTALVGAGEDVDVEVRVTYGVHGVASEVLLDAMMGGRFSVVASFLRVDARLATTGPAVAAGVQVRVGAVAAHAAAGSSQGQRTLSAAVAIAPATVGFAIPAYSKGVTVLVTPVSPAGGYSLSWLNAAGVAIATMDFPTGLAAFGTGPGPEQPSASAQNGPRAGMPIPSRARTLLFTNGGAARTNVAAIFEVQS